MSSVDLEKSGFRSGFVIKLFYKVSANKFIYFLLRVRCFVHFEVRNIASSICQIFGDAVRVLHII
jgi:hypothetical protein